MRIARAKPGDAAALTQIAFQAKRQWGYPEKWIRRWMDALTVTASYLRANPTFAARPGERIVGFASLKLGGKVAHLEHIWVVPASMGTGTATSLFRRCEREARRAGATVLKMECDPNAEGFFHAMGAVTVGRRAARMGREKRFLPLLEKRLVLVPSMPKKDPRRGYTVSWDRSAQKPEQIHAYLTRSY